MYNKIKVPSNQCTTHNLCVCVKPGTHQADAYEQVTTEAGRQHLGPKLPTLDGQVARFVFYTFSFYPKPPVLGFLDTVTAFGNSAHSSDSVRQEVTFSKLSLNRDSSQARGPFSGQTKQLWALWSLINNFHTAITLPDSLWLVRHKETFA